MQNTFKSIPQEIMSMPYFKKGVIKNCLRHVKLLKHLKKGSKRAQKETKREKKWETKKNETGSKKGLHMKVAKEIQKWVKMG